MTINLTFHPHRLNRGDRELIKRHKGMLVMLTGLSGSGKSTIANELEFRLNQVHKVHTYLLDGDNIRMGINRDLGFSDLEVQENDRRIGEIAKLFIEAGLVVISAVMMPFEKDRQMVKSICSPERVLETYIQCPLDLCKKRDPKGLYRKNKAGEIKGLIGVDKPYEPPVSPGFVYDTSVDMSFSFIPALEREILARIQCG